jgi:hypothetical protein
VVNNTGTSTLTVTTAGTQANLATPAWRNRSRTLVALGLLFPAMLLSGAGLNKAGRRKLFCFLLLSGCLLHMGCGAASQPSQAPKGSLTTPPGTYIVSIAGSAGATLQHTTSVSRTVQ